MAWKTGQSGNKKGRPRLDEVEKQNVSYFKQQLKKYSVPALEELFELMTNSINQDIRYKCATYILDRCYGKEFVAEKLEEQSKDITIKLITRQGTEVDQALIDLKNVILPAIGKYKMSKVTPAILEQFYRSLTKDNAKKDGKGSYKIASIKKFHKIISGIMRTAVRWNVIEENPCDKAELPRERNKSNDVKHFTLEQAMTFLEAMDKPYSVPFKGHKITVPSGKVIELDTYIKERMLPIQFKIFYRLSLFGGLRKGELIALTWQDIDFENNTLSITKSAGHVQEGQTIKATKTVNSNRIIPIPKTEIDLLSRWKTEQKNFMLTVGSKWEGYRGKEFDKNNVFIQMNVNYGKTMNVSTPYRKFVDFINYYNQTIEKEENKLPVIPLHGLRHTCATLNIALGTDIKTVQAILGHANIQTTLNTYTHALEEKKREASNALDVLLNKQA